jgi:hypothetical protein
MDWGVILPIVAGTACVVVIGVAIANSGSKKVSPTTDTYQGDSQFYSEGGRKRTRRRKHRK